MSDAKEIRGKIASVKNTQKITSAMEMVAASKMRRVQERMHASRPYAKAMHAVINRVAAANLAYVHPYLVPRDIQEAGYVVITTDRGLCGGLNVNLFKEVLTHVGRLQQTKKNIGCHMGIIGQRGKTFFSHYGVDLQAYVAGLGDKPQLEQLIGLTHIMLDAYNDKKIDVLYLAYNQFENTMSQKPVIEQLLPLPETQEQTLKQKHWDYLYEPEPEMLLARLLTRYVESQIYQGVVENLACEQAARMVAMKSATDNAASLIDELQLIYNKARQASITQELSEIVAGAAAV